MIIVDDGSTDTTAEIIRKYLISDNRIKYIYQQNKRLGAARNTGIKAAKGDWVAFLDSDDLWVREKLAKQIEASSIDPTIDIIFTDGYIFFDSDLTNIKPYPTISGKFTGKKMYKLQYNYNHIAVLSVLVKKEYIDKVGLQDESTFIHGCEDWDYWIRLAKAGATFLGLEDKLFYYRRHSFNMSSNHIQMSMAEAFVYIKNLEPSYLSPQFIKEKFQNALTPLIEELLHINKVNEAKFLIKEFERIVPGTFQKFTKILIFILGGKAYHPYKTLRKLTQIL